MPKLAWQWARNAGNETDLLGAAFADRQSRHPATFPCLRESPRLILAIDWAGLRTEHLFSALSVLATDEQGCALWGPLRTQVHEQHLHDRRMSFKNLGDKVRRRGLAPFLDAADIMPGLLFTLLVDKRIEDRLVGTQLLDFAGDIWGPGDNVRMCKTAFMIAFLLAGLSTARQSVQVLLDEDSIFDTDARQRRFLDMLRNIGLERDDSAEVSVATPSMDAILRQVTEDLFAIPDLAAGALSELGARDPRIAQSAIGPLHADRSAFQEKTLSILDWLSDRQRPLRRVTCLFREIGDDPRRAQVIFLDPFDGASPAP